MNGINIIINGVIYHFDNPNNCSEILRIYADDTFDSKTLKTTCFYDDEMKE